MNQRDAQYRFNFLEYWKSEYETLNGQVTGTQFFNWCADFDNLQEFISIYYDWAATSWDDKYRPRIELVEGKMLRWVGDE